MWQASVAFVDTEMAWLILAVQVVAMDLVFVFVAF